MEGPFDLENHQVMGLCCGVWCSVITGLAVFFLPLALQGPVESPEEVGQPAPCCLPTRPPPAPPRLPTASDLCA